MISILLGCIFLLLSAIHLYWACGGSWALDKTLPTRSDGTVILNPGKGLTLVVAIGLFLFALIYLGESSLITLPTSPSISYYSVRVISFIFLIRTIGDFKYCGIFKRVKGTVFAKYDTSLYTPICLMIGVLGILQFFI